LSEPSETHEQPAARIGVFGLPETSVPLPDAPPRARLSSVIGRLAFVNAAIGIAAVVTGPLQARALGADGRGELAAILVPFVLAPLLLSVALGTYAARESASGRRPVNELVGSVGVPLLVMTVIGMAAGFPAAGLLAEGNDTVRTYLIVGFMLLPIGMAGTLLAGLMAGLERWSLVIVQRAVLITVPSVGIVIMYVLDEMTVGRVVIVTMAGAVLSILPAAAVVMRSGRPVFRRATARASVNFGLRTWAGGLALIANVHLDQLLMIVLVSDRELGLYAVAVTLARLTGGFLINALSPPLMTRIAQGETALVPRALRVVLVVVGFINLAVAAVTPIALPAIFGTEFKDAVDQTLVLLLAGIPLAGNAILTTALAADGAPGKASIAEGAALVITIPGLLVLVPVLGGLGAAIVGLVAYSVSFTYQVHVMRNRLGGSRRSFLLPRAEDARWAMQLVLRKRRSA
jgi:O-antigen/teichoic acid export membrane protein